MSRQEARDYLEQFLAETGPRLDALRREVAASGGSAADALDLSPESLELLWEWAKPRLSWRAGWEPGTAPQRPLQADEVEPADQLPSWFDIAVSGWGNVSRETLWLIDGVARYLGECFLATVPGTAWTVGYNRRKNYVHQNHVIVTGLPRRDDCEPLHVTCMSALRALRGQPASLLDLYQVWIGAVD